MKNAVIVGAGWLGETLSNTLLLDSWHVCCTTRSAEKAKLPHWAYFASEQVVEHDISVANAYWIFAVPAGRTLERQAAYKKHLESALEIAKELNAKGFVLCSSTGVYPDEPGHYDETSRFAGVTDKNERLLASEMLVVKSGLPYKIARLAGLIGPQRHPGRFLAGKTLSSSGSDCVNMVHQYDASAGLKFILSQFDQLPEVFNLVAPHHPAKADFYRAAAAQLGLQEPNFAISSAQSRLVSGNRICEFGFTYRYDNLFDAIGAC